MGQPVEASLGSKNPAAKLRCGIFECATSGNAAYTPVWPELVCLQIAFSRLSMLDSGSVAMCHKPTNAVQHTHLYSMTSSARIRTDWGMMIPRAFAVL